MRNGAAAAQPIQTLRTGLGRLRVILITFRVSIRIPAGALAMKSEFTRDIAATAVMFGVIRFGAWLVVLL